MRVSLRRQKEQSGDSHGGPHHRSQPMKTSVARNWNRMATAKRSPIPIPRLATNRSVRGLRGDPAGALPTARSPRQERYAPPKEMTARTSVSKVVLRTAPQLNVTQL